VRRVVSVGSAIVGGVLQLMPLVAMELYQARVRLESEKGGVEVEWKVVVGVM
jgi:hypothetical protein